jgi:hypothetical protein
VRLLEQMAIGLRQVRIAGVRLTYMRILIRKLTGYRGDNMAVSEYSRMDWGAGNVRRLPNTGLQGKYPYRFRDRDDKFVGPVAPDWFNNNFYSGGTIWNV